MVCHALKLMSNPQTHCGSLKKQHYNPKVAHGYTQLQAHIATKSYSQPGWPMLEA